MTSDYPNLSPMLEDLATRLEGELKYDTLTKTLYATDASVYREIPLAVAFPKSEADIQKLIQFAKAHKTSLIPRTAGTSLAGQCVGNGIVVDVSKHFTEILEFNAVEKWVRVQPGVVRDELNRFLKPHGLFFSPITSTANRAMIGGMVGNNSSGTTSIVYGTTRDKVMELKTMLSDGSQAVFGPISITEFEKKCVMDGLEGSLYRQVRETLSQPGIQKNIRDHFPKKSIHRRNTGYAVDALLDSNLFTEGGEAFNFCQLLAGSEGTLAFTTEVKIKLDPLPEPVEIVVAAHFTSINQSMKAAQVAMKHPATAVELMDKIILDCTKESLEYGKNRYFVEGDPMALLMIEFTGKTEEEARAKGEKLIEDLQAADLGYAYPVIGPDLTKSAWALRSAGLGLLANIPGDRKAVACIEDTAVDIDDLADYIEEFDQMMVAYGQEPVHYAHAGAGEIHLRPILDLKKKADQEEFYNISLDVAKLVKKYRGSLSGEHGDGRVRAPFIPLMVGEENYQLFRRIKYTWDPDNIFNPGKIVDTAPMNTSLRYTPDMVTPEQHTLMDFSHVGGFLRLAEKCNGSGDCRKLPGSGGTMCPSYQATRNEKETTRGRANTLREFLTLDKQSNPFDHPEIKEALDLCLSCKGCTSECPSNVDMASMKAEFLYQYQKTHGIPLRSKAFAHINELNGLASIMPGLANFSLSNGLTGGLMKSVLGVAPKRNLPQVSKLSLRKWYKRNYASLPGKSPAIKSFYLFIDEFTNHNDTHIGIPAIKLLKKLGYDIKVIAHEESGRSALSKGLLEKARKHAEANVVAFQDLVDGDVPLVGIEPSAILSFRDEYPRLVRKEFVEGAKKLKFHTLLIDEFIGREIASGNISANSFTNAKRTIKLHGHCHQKALSSLSWTKKLLELPRNYQVEVIPSGCCGMAGSFGYEAEHYALSMQIGEMVLFPAVRDSDAATQIAAPGTSCRHQIADGTGKKAKHPVEILFEALNL
ncbi:FAD-binding and (Fe-S)-binding domain-containing protein [Pararhodonellum marinum]|uniref:FAD-binding and (Fe-S)-binding domain-containing protein n=1 Tax=Pararhodonellum marinum TaxID=2755358 RepID=UPI00188E7FDC|nr:FAD-binding and (Fe-S)-binding domain-containing protein [Pararhodonellum marinum]